MSGAAGGGAAVAARRRGARHGVARHRDGDRGGVSGESLRTLTRGLGWFSIGLGLAELLAPRAMARATGMRGREGLLAGYGAREIATGIGILAARNPTPWIWGRVAGDALDLATIAPRLDQFGAGRRARAGTAFAAVLGVAALDLACALVLTASGAGAGEPTSARRDYSDRSGLPRPPEAMRGAAARDFAVPRDMRIPEPLRPYATR